MTSKNRRWLSSDAEPLSPGSSGRRKVDPHHKRAARWPRGPSSLTEDPVQQGCWVPGPVHLDHSGRGGSVWGGHPLRLGVARSGPRARARTSRKTEADDLGSSSLLGSLDAALRPCTQASCVLSGGAGWAGEGRSDVVRAQSCCLQLCSRPSSLGERGRRKTSGDVISRPLMRRGRGGRREPGRTAGRAAVSGRAASPGPKGLREGGRQWGGRSWTRWPSRVGTSVALPRMPG